MLLGGLDGKESSCNAGDLGRFPWRRAWQPTLVFLQGESPWTEEPGGLQSMGSQELDMTEQLNNSTEELRTFHGHDVPEQILHHSTEAEVPLQPRQPDSMTR